MFFAIGVCLLIPVFLASCHHTSKTFQTLQQADSLMEKHPDSSLRLLKTISPRKLQKTSDIAYYALLKTEADDKNYIEHRDTSLIRKAVDYYGRRSDRLKSGMSYFYLGRVYQDENNIYRAVEAYLKAAEILPSDTSAHYKMIVYNNLGDCYEANKDYNEAMNAFRQAYRICRKKNSKDESYFVSPRIGNIYMYYGKYDSALVYYQQSLQAALKKNDSSALTYDYFAIARAYEYKKRYRLADDNIQKAVDFDGGQLTDEYRYLKADIWVNRGIRLDSARIFLLEASRNKDLYVKEGCAHTLYRLEKKAGHLKKAAIYNDISLALRDSIEAKKDYTIENIILKNHEKKLTSLSSKNRHTKRLPSF